MHGIAFGLTDETVYLWLINILLTVTWITILAFGGTRVLYRYSTSRHSLLLMTLCLVIVSPVLLAGWQYLGYGAFRVQSRSRLEVIGSEQRSIKGSSPSPDKDTVGVDTASADTVIVTSMTTTGIDTTDLAWEGVPRSGVSFDFEMAPFDEGPEKAVAATVPNQGQISPGSNPAKIQNRLLSRLLVIVPLLAFIWLVGIVLLLVRFVRGFFRLRTVLKTAEVVTDSTMRQVFEATVRTMDVALSPAFLLSDRVFSPVSVGLFNQAVILPKSIINQITEPELSTIFRHELAHLRRCDGLIVTFQGFVGTLFWIHPLVRLLNRQLAQAREEICDNYVLQAADATSYSRTLLKLATLVSPQTSLFGTIALFSSDWKLEHRVAGLLDVARRHETTPSWRQRTTSCAIAMAAVGVAFLGTFAITNSDQGTAVANDGKVAKSPAVAMTERTEPRTTPSVVNGLLSLDLTLRLPDGQPAPSAIVSSLSEYLSAIDTQQADASGRVIIRSVFGQGASLHASTADGRYQATLRVEPADIRKAFSQPVTLNLHPAIEHHVTVTFNGKPVADALVRATSERFQVGATSGLDGIARLMLPADDRLQELSAWHDTLGVAGAWLNPDSTLDSATALALLPSEPVSILAVDPGGKHVPGAELSVSSLVMHDRREGNQRYAIVSRGLPGSKLRTNERGEATLTWPPGDKLSYLAINSDSPDWQIDEVDPMRDGHRAVTVHLRRTRVVKGRLIMPDGISPEGLLITGDGFGPGHHGCSPQMRARSDGTFEFHAASNYGFLLGVLDQEWISEPWTGIVLKSEDAEPPEITIKCRPATPIKVRVTHGSRNEPLAGAAVDFSSLRQIPFLDKGGQRQQGMASIGGWLKTDSAGCVHGGIPAGKTQIRVAYGRVDQRQTVTIKDGQPAEFAVHLDLPTKRKVVARMTRDGSAYQPSPQLRIQAWSNKPPQVATMHRTIVHDDHSIEVNFDDSNLCLLAIDPATGLSGFVKEGEIAATAEIAMQPMAKYSGQVVNDAGNPIPNLPLRLTVEGPFVDVVESIRTNANGRFQFTKVPAETPLRTFIKPEGERASEYSLFDQVTFQPEEVREDVIIKAFLRNQQNRPVEGAARKSPAVPLSKRLEQICENARVTGMRALLILQGDASQNVAQLTRQILQDDDDDQIDDEEATVTPSIYCYLPLTLGVDDLAAETAYLKDHQWPMPQKNEIVLLAIDGAQQLLGSTTVKSDSPDVAKKSADQFLDTHRSVFEDAQVKLAAARTEAARDGRRILLIIGGPRCGPCFRMARWLDQHKSLLARDYAVVKFMEGLHPHTDVINQEIGGSEHGVPWFVITEPDGTILTTSESVAGNIGMPTSIEEVRHFRKMLERTTRKLTHPQIDLLIESLIPKDSQSDR